jgi:hypothetical protein
LPGIAHFRDNGEEACDALAGEESQGEQTGMQGTHPVCPKMQRVGSRLLRSPVQRKGGR